MARAPRPRMRAWRRIPRGAAVAVALLAAVPGAAQTILSASYDGPTTRYPHGVLGDAVEYDTLVARLSDGRTVSARWSDEIVFEDIAPRVVDVDGDGAPEIVVVESHADTGARLAIWGLVAGRLQHIATTPHIGTRFRWLAPVAVADLDGDGRVELAYVDRPHLAKVLRVWRFMPGNGVTEVASLPGVTNHRIGWNYIAGGLRDCGQGPEMVLADADWTQVVAVTFDGDRLSQRSVGAYSDLALELALAC